MPLSITFPITRSSGLSLSFSIRTVPAEAVASRCLINSAATASKRLRPESFGTLPSEKTNGAVIDQYPWRGTQNQHQKWALIPVSR